MAAAAVASPVRFYIAGKFADMHRINALVRHLELSHSLYLQSSYDWTQRAIHNKVHYESPDEMHARWVDDAVLDVQGVRDADIVLALMDDPNYSYRGTNNELGCAIGLNKPVIIVNPGGDAAPIAQNVFYWFPTVQHAASIDEGVTLLYKWAAAAVVASASAASLP